MERARRLLREATQVLATLARPAARSVRGNAGLAVLSVVLAFGLWIFVTDTNDQTRSGVLAVDLVVEPVNPAPDVTVANELAVVRPRLSVSSDVWNSLTAADFKATVDLDGLRVGVYDLPVKVTAQTSRGGLRVVGAAPGQIEVDLEPLFSKSVPVAVDIKGDAPDGFRVGAPEAEDDAATVTGPQARVEQVVQAVAPLDVTGRTESVRQAVRLEARDARGFLVQGVSLEPSVTEVKATLERALYSRTLVVSPDVRGAPTQGYNVAGISVSPSVVTVFGSQSFVQGTTLIRTQPVDIGDVKADVVRSVSLDLPAGASVNGSVSVTVTVNIEAAAGQIVLGVPLSPAGLDPGLVITGTLPALQVTLLGPLPDLLSLGPSGVSAMVDLSGLGAGSHTVTVKVTPPSGILVAAVTPSEVQVILEKR
ncbi:MAG TPA: CdaR family protein [Dehalococcoidia bacterium]|nr:CdaR family protein [Dehalococcoidia bacterium]